MGLDRGDHRRCCGRRRIDVDRIALEQNDPQRAAEALGRSLARRPDSPSTRYQYGRALIELGESDLAREALRMALEGGGFPEEDAARQALAKLEEGDSGRDAKDG